jgi:exodeoxyribonuclease V alpha subunit
LQEYRVDVQATTIHRLLAVERSGHNGNGWRFKHHVGNPLPYRFVVIDEASMLDTDLAAALLSACGPGTHVLFLGDIGQLLPVGHGAPLRDLIAAGVPCGQLTEIHRNAGLIVRACVQIKEGRQFETAQQCNPDAGENLRHVETRTADESIEKLRGILARFRQSGRFDPLWDCQVLVAVNANSKLSRQNLNRLLQAELNSDGLRAEPNPFRVGDKIICLKNSTLPLVGLRPGGTSQNVDEYQDVRDVGGEPISEFVANGDIGCVLGVAPKLTVARFTLPDRTFKIPTGAPALLDDGANESGTGCDFSLAYVVTTHKMQGSEAPCIIAMIDGDAGAMRVTSREWWYTALSRAQRLCITIGKRAVLERQCRRTILDRRKTFLKELLTEEKHQGATAHA